MTVAGTVAIRVFGSVARGDADELSDADVLVVHSRRLSPEEKALVEFSVSEVAEKPPSFSWYSEQRLREMYAAGELFAWHLHKESLNLITNQPDFIDQLRPADYRTSVKDIASFLEILGGTQEWLAVSPGNAAYEAGLLFLCARNIAMSASWYLQEGPFFGRRSPFQLEERLGIHFPLTEYEHSQNMRARVICHRGLPVGMRSADRVVDMSRRLERWGNTVFEYVQRTRENYHDRSRAAVS